VLGLAWRRVLALQPLPSEVQNWVAVLHSGLNVDGLGWLYLKIKNEDTYASICSGSLYSSTCRVAVICFPFITGLSFHTERYERGLRPDSGATHSW
jgi:hypothetical protein